MPTPEEPLSATKKILRMRGAVQEGDEALGFEQRSYEDERGIVDEEETLLVVCSSCGRAIHQQEEVGGICCRCSGVVDVRCAEEVRCAHRQCGRVLCRNHASNIGDSYWCPEHDWSSLINAGLVIAGLFFLLLLVAIWSQT